VRQRSERGLIADPSHGPLPMLLLGLTVLSGVVDAVSILRLGRVFVANMTGNVVFVGFALAGAPGFILSASLLALGGFLVGGVMGGSMAERLGRDRAVLLRAGAVVELLLLLGSLVITLLAGTPLSRGAIDVVAAISAIAMGVQNTVARRLAVPDLTTTVLTMALTGIAADRRPHAGGRDTETSRLRRALAVVAMLVGAIVGAELVLHVGPAAGFGLAVAILAAVAAAAAFLAGRPGAWRVHS
jgi:uncharacterized membrane protein YoaK (UPF0700 family)